MEPAWAVRRRNCLKSRLYRVRKSIQGPCLESRYKAESESLHFVNHSKWIDGCEKPPSPLLGVNFPAVFRLFSGFPLYTYLFVVVKFLQSVRFQLVEITAVPAQIRIGSQEWIPSDSFPAVASQKLQLHHENYNTQIPRYAILDTEFIREREENGMRAKLSNIQSIPQVVVLQWYAGWQKAHKEIPRGFQAALPTRHTESRGTG